VSAKPIREMSPSGPARGVGALDRVAERLAAEAGVELGVADSPSDLIAAHRLRYRDASAHGRATAEGDRDGLERDAFDVRALQVCAWDRDTLVGTLRVVLPMPGKRLPVEEAFDLTVEPAGEVVDVGAPVVAPGLGAERAKQVTDGLLAQAWFETRARGYLVMSGVASSRLAERYRALGLDVEVLGRLGDRTALRIDPSIG
jgi:GNAT acetyltransferase-like protein